MLQLTDASANLNKQRSIFGTTLLAVNCIECGLAIGISVSRVCKLSGVDHRRIH